MLAEKRRESPLLQLHYSAIQSGAQGIVLLHDVRWHRRVVQVSMVTELRVHPA